MTEVIQAATLLRCRRCHKQYELPATSRALFRACPHCGAAPMPLWRRIGRHNGVAAVMCVAALVVLAAAMVMPFISMTKLGDERVFSLLSAIGELFDRGNWLIGGVLFAFSVIFPFAKLLALLAATSSLTRMSVVARKRLHKIAMLTGKYSLLEILVVAIMIVLVKFQGLAEVKAQPGTILFCIAILLSILAGVFVDLRNVQVEQASGNE